MKMPSPFSRHTTSQPLPHDFRNIACAVTEFISGTAQLIRDRNKEVRKRNIIAILQMRSVFEAHILATTEDDGVIDRLVGFACRASVEAEGVV